MRAEHLEILVEEPSMEQFLWGLLPRLLMERASFTIHPHRGKDDLLKKLPARLRGYASWLHPTWRIVVVVDQDDSACATLKGAMEASAAAAGFSTRSTASVWRVVNRIAVEELEAWYFGDWDAVRQAYPRVHASLPEKQRYRDPDAIAGGTWEAFERELKAFGYFEGGLPKLKVAEELGKLVDPNRNRSRSFQCFRDALLEAVR